MLMSNIQGQCEVNGGVAIPNEPITCEYVAVGAGVEGHQHGKALTAEPATALAQQTHVWK